MRKLAFLLPLSLAGAVFGEAGVEPARDGRCTLLPRWTATPASDKALAQLHARDDVFSEERVHEEIRPRLSALADGLRVGKLDWRSLATPAFLGSRLTPARERTI